MPNIVLTRIDNRLVHGQVATQWCGAIGANLILVANDEVAGNTLRQGLMNYGMRFVILYRRQGSRPSPWKGNAKKQNGCLGRPYKYL